MDNRTLIIQATGREVEGPEPPCGDCGTTGSTVGATDLGTYCCADCHPTLDPAPRLGAPSTVEAAMQKLSRTATTHVHQTTIVNLAKGSGTLQGAFDGERALYSISVRALDPAFAETPALIAPKMIGLTFKVAPTGDIVINLTRETLDRLMTALARARWTMTTDRNGKQ